MIALEKGLPLRIVQHLHFFEKKSEKYKRNKKHTTKNITKNTKCISMKYIYIFFFDFSDLKK
jgi:ribosomal protein S21